MLKNAFTTLARRQTGVRVLYAQDYACDPRADPQWCHLVSDWSRLAPFFNMISSIGTIDFKAYTSVDPYAYDVVILDTCRTNLTAAVQASVTTYINTARGGMFVVGSNSCMRGTTMSSQLANTILQQYGIGMTLEDPGTRGCNAVPAAKQTGILEGVSTLSFFRVVPQVVASPARSVFEDTAGRPLISVYERTDS